MEYGVEEKVTNQSNVSATMLVGFPLGVTCRLKLTRSSQTYVFPFHLSDEILPQPIFYGTICPVVLWFTIKKLVLEPLEVKRREEKRRRKREANKEKVAIARREAEASISLMEERFARIVGEEEAKARWRRQLETNTSNYILVIREFSGQTLACKTLVDPTGRKQVEPTV